MEELPSRWEVELEFVQSLANIQYVNFLAQNGYFLDAAFLAYLKYLNYWQDAKYAKYLVYPNCLHILTLLQQESFRRDIVNPDFMNTLMNDMVNKWLRQEEAADGASEQNGGNEQKDGGDNGDSQRKEDASNGTDTQA